MKKLVVTGLLGLGRLVATAAPAAPASADTYSGHWITDPFKC
jgi:hypothetical protein